MKRKVVISIIVIISFITVLACGNALLKKIQGEYDATDEGRNLISAYADGMGMTVREYWEYNKKYQAPAAVTHGKVSRYLENNGLEAPSYDEIESKITDKEYFDSLT